jgi:23S rRNA (guanosine2251-2'-O)-methyltransferase
MDSTLLTGRKPVLEALEQGRPIEKIFVLHGVHGQGIDAIFRMAKQRGIPIRQTPKDRFRQFAKGQEAQGVAAIMAQVEYLEMDALLAIAGKESTPFILILDEIEDPHNLGALLRSALCFGVHGVVVPRHHAATVNATVIKTSAGAALSIPIARVANISRAIEEVKEAGIMVVGTDAAAGKALDDIPVGGGIALVVGNEGKGIRRLVKETCDLLVRIPMGGSFESLNASVAGAIAMYVVMGKLRKDVQELAGKGSRDDAKSTT